VKSYGQVGREFKLRPFSAGSILRLRNKIEPLASNTSVDLLLQNRSYRASPRRYRSGYWPHYPTWHSGLLHCGASRLKHPSVVWVLGFKLRFQKKQTLSVRHPQWCFLRLALRPPHARCSRGTKWLPCCLAPLFRAL